MFISEDLVTLQTSLRKIIEEAYSAPKRRKYIDGSCEGVVQEIRAKISALGLEEVFIDTDFNERASLLGVIAFEEGRALLPVSISENLLCSINGQNQSTCGYNYNGMIYAATANSVVKDGEKFFLTKSTEERVKLIDISREYSKHIKFQEIIPQNESFFNSSSFIIKAAEISGICDFIFSEALAYLKTRKQYGKLLGEFQALQHKAAECFLVSQATNSLSQFAAFTTDKKSDEKFSSISSLHYALTHAPKLIETCLQLLGGIGFTWEYDLHFYLRRVKFLEAVFLDSLGEDLFEAALSRDPVQT